MSLVSAALTLFATILIVAHVQRRTALALSIGGLALALYVLPGPAQVAAPLAAILTIGLGESLAGLRPR